MPQKLLADEAVELAIEGAESAVGRAHRVGKALQPGQHVDHAPGAHRAPELLVPTHQPPELDVSVAVAAAETKRAHDVSHGHPQAPGRIDEGAAGASAHQEPHRSARLSQQGLLQEAARRESAQGRVRQAPLQFPQLGVAAEGQAPSAGYQLKGRERRPAREGGPLADEGLADGALAAQHYHRPSAQAQLENAAVGGRQASES